MEKMRSRRAVDFVLKRVESLTIEELIRELDEMEDRAQLLRSLLRVAKIRERKKANGRALTAD
jgi:predicted DNA-binding ribbon-helix-helix protein